MRRFREIFLNELVTYQPQVTRIVGVYDLPDLGAATQLWQTPVGGYRSYADMANWLGRQAQYNVRYPLEEHGIDPSRTDSEIRSLSYAQMKSAMIDLASRVQSIGSVLASEGTRPEDKHMTARLRHARFKGQKIQAQMGTDDQGKPLPPTRTPVNDENVDMFYIMMVDVRAFTGEVSGRGGTQGFKVGEALDVIIPTKDTRRIGEAYTVVERLTPDAPTTPATNNSNFGAAIGDPTMTPVPMQNGGTNPPHFDSFFDIDVRKLDQEMRRALKIFSQFERKLEGWKQIAGWGDMINQELGRGHISPSFGTNPGAFR